MGGIGTVVVMQKPMLGLNSGPQTTVNLWVEEYTENVLHLK